MKVDRNIDAGALTLPQSFETLRHLIHEFLSLDVFERGPRRIRSDFHRVDAGSRIHLAVDADPVARRAAEQLINRHSVDFALDVPERLIDPAEDGGLNRPAAVKRPRCERVPQQGSTIDFRSWHDGQPFRVDSTLSVPLLN